MGQCCDLFIKPWGFGCQLWPTFVWYSEMCNPCCHVPALTFPMNWKQTTPSIFYCLIFSSFRLLEIILFCVFQMRSATLVVCLFQWICPAATEIEGIEPLSASSCRFLPISWLFAGDTVSEWWHRCWLCGIIFIKKKLKLTSIQGKIIYYFIFFEKQIIKRDYSYISPQAIALFLQIGECKGTTKWREMLKRANTKRRK